MISKAFNKLAGMLGGNKPSSIYDYKEMTDTTMAVNVSILSSYLMNSYRFDGLPDELDQNLIWAMLVQFSTCVLFYNTDMDKFMFLPYVREDYDKQNNFMFKPTKVVARDYVGNNYKVVCEGIADPNEKEYQGVVVHISNTSRFNLDLHHMLFFYASKMTAIDRSIDVRRNYHRAPVIFTGKENLKSTFETLFTGITEFKPFYVTTELFNDTLNTIAMDFNYMNGELYNEKQLYQNEFLNLWGINNNVGQDKKERLITDEVNANNEQLLINRDNVLNSLAEFTKDIKETFNIDVIAYFSHDTTQQSFTIEDIEEVEEDVIDEINN